MAQWFGCLHFSLQHYVEQNRGSYYDRTGALKEISVDDPITVLDGGRAYRGTISELVVDDTGDLWIQGKFFPKGEGRSAVKVVDERVC